MFVSLIHHVIFYFFFFNRYLSDEGIEACLSSSEKVNTNDIILVALNVSYGTENVFF